MSQSTPLLSRTDARILAQVFDPESASSRAEVIVDPALSADRYILDVDLILTLREREKEAVRHIEEFEKSPRTSDSERTDAYHNALAILNQLILEFPNYGSAYNNRAQLRRWYWGDRNTLCQPRESSVPERAKAAEAVVRDLNRTVILTSPARPIDAISPSQARLLAQAYTQLGAVYYAASKDANGVPPDPDHRTSNEYEEEASRYFYLGGLYGNEVAKAMAVHANPQAKLCGSIVKEAMRKELALHS
jgi:hypothetical protein